MKSFTILALSAASLAAPLMEKRDTVHTTVMEQVWETVYTTTTVWIDPTDIPTMNIGAFYEHPQAPTTTSTPPAYTAPAAESKPQTAAPVAAQSAPAYVAPAYVAPSPAATTMTPAYVAPVASAAPAAPASSPASSSGSYSGSSSGSGDHTGDMTYYDVTVGLGSCGTTASNSDNVVALSHLDMNNGVNPNANPLCGKMINIYSSTGVHQAKVFDTCPACAEGSIDLPQPLFEAIAPSGNGRVHGITWSFA